MWNWIKGLFGKKAVKSVSKPYVPPESIKPVSQTQNEITEKRLRDELVNFWRQDLGQRETDGHNRSPMIDHINRRLGVPLGSPYCIGGLLTEGVEPLCKYFGLKNPVHMVAGTQDFYDSTPSKYKKPKGQRGDKADICILVNKGDASHGHAYGLTEDQLGPLTQKSIEYNTNGGGSRDGDGVYELTRSQEGSLTKNYRGAVDVVRWICDANGIA